MSESWKERAKVAFEKAVREALDAGSTRVELEEVLRKVEAEHNA